jgi:hypothetical protein
MGSDNPDYCILLALGIHLETSITRHGIGKQAFNFGKKDGLNKKGMPSVPIKSNFFIQNTLRNKIIGHNDFKRRLEGTFGMHSVRKHATTRAQ